MIATNTASINIDPGLALVIDDDANVRQFIVTSLTQLGMRVADFQMAKEALASLDSAHPAVIFLDVALLRSDAIDVLRGLGRRRYGGVVQLMSGGRQSLLEAVQRIGVREGVKLAAPLGKPLAREAIAQLIHTMRSPAARKSPDEQTASAAPAAGSR